MEFGSVPTEAGHPPEAVDGNLHSNLPSAQKLPAVRVG
jgi:hypothetical protein